ncbi:UNVERIFIED_ORG: hypothetical protein GGD59_003229 [Rhizobium esperanzae]
MPPLTHEVLDWSAVFSLRSETPRKIGGTSNWERFKLHWSRNRRALFECIEFGCRGGDSNPASQLEGWKQP